VVEALERRGRSRAAAAAIATMGLTLIVIVVVAIALIQIAGPLNDAAATAARGGSTVGASGGTATGWIDGATSQVSAGVVRVVRELGSGLAEFGVVLVLGVLLTFYCLRDGQRVWASKISRVSPWRRREISEAASRSVGVLGGYMAGTAVVSLVGAVSMFAIMAVLGIPYAVPVALLSFFLGFIPYIGGFIATAAAFLITASTGDTTDIVIMLIWTVVFNIVQGNVVSPLVYGRTVDLHPAIVLLAIPAGGQIAGVIGMFLVVPFLGIVSVSWRTVLRAAGDAPPVVLTSEPDAEVADDPARGGGADRVPGGDAIEPAT
jgi:putative heme transporter